METVCQPLHSCTITVLYWKKSTDNYVWWKLGSLNRHQSHRPFRGRNSQDRNRHRNHHRNNHLRRW
jgi:hypothetical protein